MGYSQGSRFAGMAGSYMHGLGSSYRPNRYQAHGQLYSQTPSSAADNISYSQAAMNSLTQAFGATNLSNNVPMGVGKAVNNSMAANNMNLSNMLGMQSTGQPFYYQYPDTNMMFSGIGSAQQPYAQYTGDYGMNYMQTPFVGQQAYSGYGAPMTQDMSVGQRYGTWTASQQIPVEVPELTARRNSQSSNEDSGPKTPFNLNTYGHGNYPSGYPEYDEDEPSPFRDPTPTSLARKFPFKQIWRTENGGYEFVDYFAKTREEPAIPVAIPATLTKDSGRGTFDKILDNEHGTTNVYIRGLHPNTTDELLRQYGSRFGEIVSCKAIINLNDGDCKG